MKIIAKNIITALILFLPATSSMAQDSTRKTIDTAGKKPFNQTLGQVTVTALKSNITYKADKTIVGVAGSPIATGGNAWEVLLRAPGVTQQGNGLQLRNKGVNVLIDGRATNLSGDDLKSLLSSLPANGIASIELIHTPSAKYDAQGGAVINIIMAKNSLFGTSGTVTAGGGGGMFGLYNAGLAINHRSKKINAAAGYDFQHTEQYSRREFTRLIDNKAVTVTDNRYEAEARNGHTFRAGVDYSINKRQVMGLTVKGLLNYRDRVANTRSVSGKMNGVDDSLSTVATTGTTRLLTPSVNLYYKATLDANGKELRVNADYMAFDKRLNDGFATRFFDVRKVEYAPASLLRVQAPASNDVASLTIDYNQPVKKGSFEAGLKGALATTDNDARWELDNGNGWAPDAGKTNHFIYKEQVYAAYAILNKTFTKFELQAGLRAEQTFTEGYSVTLQQANKNQYFNLFPHLSVSYNASKAHQFSFSYRKSIERYKYDIVNPFIIYKSQYSWYQGNPNLMPGIAHNFSLTHTWNNSLNSSLSYGRFENVLSNIYKKDPASPAVIATWGNFNSADYLELSISYSKSLLNNKWISNNYISAFSARYNESSEVGLYTANLATYVSSDNLFMLGKGFKWQLGVNWFSPVSLGVTTMRSRFSLNTGLSKTVAGGKGTVTLNVSDVFNTEVSRFEVSSYGVHTSNRDKAESRFVKASFAWRFGNKNVKNATRKTGIESESRRMQ